ncbi:hypothetical protein [Mycoplasma parvum]|uniref:Uncharacterized protein n=1 Tax=Mycoplasma parvum str. Indiana TaxID=1403316 RepID=U5NFW9_9MOLU|nr:hypothetical protein [Mycoplasma parvum]AGX89143.1 hypothetical protein PRV_02025 [Mycoplasma parvum str. Indiana]
MIGCPVGACTGVSYVDSLKVGSETQVDNNRVVRYENIVINGERKISLGNEMKVAISNHDSGKFGKKVKVEVPCLDGDMIGNNDWTRPGEGQNGDVMRIQEFFRKVEDGLKGYLNLFFSCHLRDAIYSATSNKWSSWDKIGRENREIAAVISAIRGRKEGIGKWLQKRGVKTNEHNNLEISHEERNYLQLFSGRTYGRFAKVRVPVENLALEVWVYKRNEFQGTYKDQIQKRVRQALAKSVVTLMLNGKWCVQKDSHNKDCKKQEKYKKENVLPLLKGWAGKLNESEEFELDGKFGIQWHPKDEDGGKPRWIWDKLQEKLKNVGEWWREFKVVLENLGQSSWHKNIQDKVARAITYLTFCDLIGPERKMIMETLRLAKSNQTKQKEMCSVGINGLICPEGGAIWKK